MAINKGIVDIEGKIGGLSFYKMNGKRIVRSSYGPDKNRIMTGSSYVRMRENMSEFGGASYIAKVFRLTFGRFIKNFGESYISGRLTALMKKVCSLSSGVKGERSFEFSKHRDVLKGFEFNRNSLFVSSFFVPDYIISFDVNRTVVRLKIPTFDTNTFIRAPEGSTHFKLVLSTGLLSDFEFDVGLKRYVSVNPEYSILNASDISDLIALDSTFTGDLGFITDFGVSEALPDSLVVIVELGIVFYQEINSEFYELAEGKGMRIIGVL